MAATERSGDRVARRRIGDPRPSSTGAPGAGSETNPVITALDNSAFDISRRAMNVNSAG